MSDTDKKEKRMLALVERLHVDDLDHDEFFELMDLLGEYYPDLVVAIVDGAVEQAAVEADQSVPDYMNMLRARVEKKHSVN